MKRIETTDIGMIVNDRQRIAAKLLIVFLVLCTTFCITARAQDTPLDEESADAFVQGLTGDLNAAVGDEDSVNSIVEKWQSRDLVGKTKRQAIDILVADVRAVVDDATIATGLRIKWIARLRPSASRANPTTPADADPTADALDTNSATAFKRLLAADLNTAVGDQDSVNSIVEKWQSRNLVGKTKAQAIDVLVADVRAVVDEPMIANGLRIKWLAKLRPAPAQPSRAANTPKPSGPPLSEADMGKVMNWIAVKTSANLLPYCYKQSRDTSKPLATFDPCIDGYAQSGRSCKATCPAGYTDAGDYCQKPAADYLPAAYPWEFRDALNLDAAKARCESTQGAGNCQKYLEMYYAKCRAGFRAAGHICTPTCPSKTDDTPTGCVKQSYDNPPKTIGTCPSGTVQKGLLCYSSCPAGFTGELLCLQTCPSQHPQECGLGCATDLDACVEDVQEKTMSVLGVALNLATAGGGSVSNSFKAAEKAIDLAGDAQDSIGAAQNILALVDQAASVFSANFAAMTSDEINKKIDGSFSIEAATQIKREYAKRHFRLTWEAHTIAAAKQVAGLVSIADPSGLLSVANAFANPICGSDVPFPQVKPLY